MSLHHGCRTGGLAATASASRSRPPGSARLSLKPWLKSCTALSPRGSLHAGGQSLVGGGHAGKQGIATHLGNGNACNTVTEGGCCLKVMSECQTSILDGLSRVLENHDLGESLDRAVSGVGLQGTENSLALWSAALMA